jgi:uncharacterized protein (TIGR00730 family)
MIKTICIFCGARLGVNPEIQHMTAQVGAILARAGVTVVYGGSERGLMGVIADSVLAEGGQVIGILPEVLRDVEVPHARLSQMVHTPCLPTRKQHMMDASDAFLILPGGYGTLDELFEILVLRKINQTQKPVIVMNHKGFWDATFAQIHRMVDEGFVSVPEGKLLEVVDTVDEFSLLIQNLCRQAG